VNPDALKIIKQELLVPYEQRFLGPKRKIYCYVNKKGVSQVFDFLNEIDDKALAGYVVSFTKMCSGHTMRRNVFKSIEGEHKLEEFKHISSQTRIVCMSDGGGLCILLRGIKGKKEDKLDKGELIRAKAMRDEYISRRDDILARYAGGKK